MSSTNKAEATPAKTEWYETDDGKRSTEQTRIHNRDPKWDHIPRELTRSETVAATDGHVKRIDIKPDSRHEDDGRPMIGTERKWEETVRTKTKAQEDGKEIVRKWVLESAGSSSS
ncbi:Nn.00g003750.m01.CDS01 [Neocucurbitaria sp. VM-36]